MHSEDHYQKGINLTESDIEKYLQNIDCYVIGRKTYETTLELGWPYGEKQVYVITSQALSSNKNSVTFVQGPILTFIQNLKHNHKNIWIAGGASLVSSCLKENIIDEIVYTIAPSLLGKGKPFFQKDIPQYALQLKDVKAFKNGFVDLHYIVNKT